MALPHAPEARQYYQAARQRLDDAQFLMGGQRTTGAIYLAGYCVECMLKALLLSMTAGAKRRAALEAFRGSKAHDYDWLKAKYFKSGGQPFPPNIARSFSFVNTWTVQIRYRAGSSKRVDAEAFLKNVDSIMSWADGRM